MAPSATHLHEDTSARGWSIRIPRRDVMLVLAALALGGGGGGAAWRFIAGEPARAAGVVAEAPSPSLARLEAELAEVKRVQRIQARNELLLCDLAARMAKQPNPCVEP